MAFLDDISKKISQASQNVVQKTKDFSDVNRINSLVADEEKKMNNNYYQIGKLYVAMYGNNHAPEFDHMISQIKESERKINDFRQQLKDIKGIVNCERCGAEVEPGVAFCGTCGAPMPKISSDGEVMVKCPACGQMISKDMRFCTGCGRPVSSF